MREYIKNLTDDLIRRNRYDEVDLRLRGEDNYLQNLVRHVQVDLEAWFVKNRIKGETLGKIMANLEIGDVMASKKELVDGLHFAGDCEDLLRELVALCLAFVIRDRLDCSQDRCPATPLYRRQQPKKGVQ